jgi:DNA-binding XRE family transcriptional regulator
VWKECGCCEDPKALQHDLYGARISPIMPKNRRPIIPVPTAPAAWVVLESNAAKKSIAKAPKNIREAYDEWAKIVRTSGIGGIQALRKSYDEKKLMGQPRMPEELYMRSSRLSKHWRVYYQVNRGIAIVTLLEVNAHEWSSPVRGQTNQTNTRPISSPADMRSLTPYYVRVRRTPGKSLRMIRQLHGMTQAALGRASDLEQATISAIEKGRIAMGPARAMRLAAALRVHPSVLLWPND